MSSFIEILTYRNSKIKWEGGTHIPPIKEMEWGTGIWLNAGADGNFPHFTYEQCVWYKVLFPHLLPPSTFSTQSVLQYDHFNFVPKSTMNWKLYNPCNSLSSQLLLSFHQHIQQLPCHNYEQKIKQNVILTYLDLYAATNGRIQQYKKLLQSTHTLTTLFYESKVGSCYFLRYILVSGGCWYLAH